MEILAFLAPISFVFALGAIAQVSALKKEVEKITVSLKKMEESFGKK